MTTVMAQPSFGLSAPSSRQDVVSVLLNDYGNSFGRGDSSPDDWSPEPALKELPPPPPGSNDKPLPSMMSMRFQLRVDEPQAPVSHYGERKSSLEQPTKIVSRSLSRSSKPPSLRLITSNGSTAKVPPTSSPPATSTAPVAAPRIVDERPLPPPPPEKSQRRHPSAMGNQQSKIRERKDSMETQDVGGSQKQAEIVGSSPVVKRKALPELTKKFKSLADLNIGPRGGKNGPLPPMTVSRKQSNDSSATITPSNVQETHANPSARSSREALSGHQPSFNGTNPPAQMPPTPDEQPSDLPPAPAKKAWGMGLPSNPRARSQDEMPTAGKHIRGKSSTGFNIMNIKDENKDQSTTAPTLNTITPGPTPSPNKTASVQAQGSTFLSAANPDSPQSPVSPISPEGNGRPFSYEVAPVAPVSPPAATTQFPPRTTSRPTAQPGPHQDPFQDGPKTAPLSQSQSQSPTLETPPFTPLVIRPIPIAAPPITDKHLKCYTNHATHVWSKNEYQPMACMVCHKNDRERKWACVWCYLRICLSCSDELVRIRGRDLSVLLEKKGVKGPEAQGADQTDKTEAQGADKTEGMPQVVVWDADAEEHADFS